MNKGILYLIIAVVFVGIILFLMSPPKPIYFDDNAKVMYFYYEGCGVCTFIKPALQELGYEGYKIKPIDVHTDEIPSGISIEGTPTFIGPDGQRIDGLKSGETVDQFKLRLQELLDKY